MNPHYHTHQPGEIFVFGSNLAGRHGKGAALDAVRLYGAAYGQGIGPQGESYAIPTKDEHLRTLDLQTISNYVHQFILYAHQHSHLSFFVTEIGTGLAGYQHKQIAPFFKNAPKNCRLSYRWNWIILN